MTDQVYIAVPHKSGKAAFTARRRNKMLCRRLGVGLITVSLKDGTVKVHCEPAPFTPRKVKARKAKLLSEFETRHGDPNKGGMTSSGCAVRKCSMMRARAKPAMSRKWRVLIKPAIVWRRTIMVGSKKLSAAFTASPPQGRKRWKSTLMRLRR